MKFCGFSLALIAAAAAAPSVGASDAAASSLRGRGHDKDSSIMTPTRLLKPDPDLLPAQANTDMPELPSETQANVNANGKENGRPFGNAATTTTTTTAGTTTTTSSTTTGATPTTTTTTTTEATTTTTTAGCEGGWRLNKAYCRTDNPDYCITFDKCPTSDAAVGNTIGEYDLNGNSLSVELDSFTSDNKVIVVYVGGSSSPVVLTLSEDGDSFTLNGFTFSIA
jgi:cytoskeletal protein RodZ